MFPTPPLDFRGFQRLSRPRTNLDKMNNDCKHLTAREVEKLIAAAKGSRNESCDRWPASEYLAHRPLHGHQSDKV